MFELMTSFRHCEEAELVEADEAIYPSGLLPSAIAQRAKRFARNDE